jgi:hypothetical protein
MTYGLYILNWLFNKNIITKNYVGNETTVFLYFNLSLNNLCKQTKNLFCVFVLPFYNLTSSRNSGLADRRSSVLVELINWQSQLTAREVNKPIFYWHFFVVGERTFQNLPMGVLASSKWGLTDLKVDCTYEFNLVSYLLFIFLWNKSNLANFPVADLITSTFLLLQVLEHFGLCLLQLWEIRSFSNSASPLTHVWNSTEEN